MSRSHRTDQNGAYCPIPSQAIRAHRLRTGKYQLTSLGLELKCSRCPDYWPADTEFFYPLKTDAGGLHIWCKACFVEWRDTHQRKKEMAA